MKSIKGVLITPMTPIAVFFTLVSLAWTGYSITDLMAAGLWGLLAAVSVDGLWGVVQFLDYKGIGGKTVRVLGWVALAAASGLLAYHGSTINPAAAIAGALPPIVAKAAWLGDIRLRRDPTALTPGQESEINDVIRDSEYIARMKAAQIRRDAAEEIALIQAQADVTLARDEADFMVGLERLRKRAELERRRPLELTAAEPETHRAAPRFTTPQGDASPAPHTTPHDAAELAEDVPEAAEFLLPKPPPRSAVPGEAAEQRDDAQQTLPLAEPLAHDRAADEALRFDGLSKADAVRRLHAADPDVPALQLVTRLAQLGVAVDASYVRTVLARSRKQPEAGTGQYL